ncbi:MAG: parallel beta-helix repeat protein [Planctomycetota bacterium]|jgi:parallel beta-helix repeat protein
MYSKANFGVCILITSLLSACSSPTGSVFSQAFGVEEEGGIALVKGEPLIITESVKVRSGDYFRPAEKDSQVGVIVLDGMRDLTVDLGDMILRGTRAGSAPDRGQGYGLVVRNCEGLKIQGGHISGYQVAVYVENSDDILIEGLEVDPVFGARLSGSGNMPNPLDRLVIQMEDSEQWIAQYGAALAIIDSSRVVVRNCKARGGQNGLIALRSEGCFFENNDFSYLSGWGIALAHCDKNEITNNRCDGVTRHGSGGRSEPDHGATGILISGGSSDNSIYGNLARRCTAGGREVFGGQASGAGNRWYGNDFSGAECVALELDRSTDTWIIANLLEGSEGPAIRARSTDRLAILQNHIELSHGAGISLGGGNRALLYQNELIDCDPGLEVVGTSKSTVLADSAHWIGENRFEDNVQDLVLDRSAGLEFWANDFEFNTPRPHLDGLVGEGFADLEPGEVWGWLEDAEGHLPSGRSLGSSLRAADGTSPEALNRAVSWVPPGSRGLPARSGPESRVETLLGEYGPWDPMGRHPRPQTEQARGLFAGLKWEATWFSWDTGSDPRGDLERWQSRRFEPIHRGQVEVWCDPWGGSRAIREEVPMMNFGMIASSEFIVERAGTYLLSEISDDGVRITIDGESVLEDWTWHPERRRSEKIELSAGSHSVNVEYFQIDGAAVLFLELRIPPGN